MEISYRPFGALRTFLALMVLASHTVDIAPISPLILSTFKIGPVAVFLFFVLSGFIITEAILAYYARRPVSFFANRLVRLYPAYAAALILALAVLIYVSPVYAPLAGNWMQPSNILANFFSIFPSVRCTDFLFGVEDRIDIISIIWAVRIEFAFYLLAGCCIFAGLFLQADNAKMLCLWALLAGMLIAHVFFFYFSDAMASATFYFSFAPYFVLGTSAALLARQKIKGMHWGFLVVLSLIFSSLRTAIYPANFGGQSISNLSNNPDTLAPLCLFTFLLFVVWLLSRVKTKKIERYDRLLGEFSYPIYLIHLPAVYLVTKLSSGSSWQHLLTVVFLTLVLSTGTVRLSEITIDRLRRYIRGKDLP